MISNGVYWEEEDDDEGGGETEVLNLSQSMSFKRSSSAEYMLPTSSCLV